MGGSRDPEIETEANYMASCQRHHHIKDGLERGWLRSQDVFSDPLYIPIAKGEVLQEEAAAW
jgi:hypothetical protein